MSYSVRNDDIDDIAEVDANSGVGTLDVPPAGGAGGADAGDDAARGARERPAWRSIAALAELSDEDAEALAVRLARLWSSPGPLDGAAPTEQEQADLVTLQAIHDEAGHRGFVVFLRSFDGVAGDVGVLLAVASFVREAEPRIRATTRYKRKEVEQTAADISELVFDGDLAAARERAVEALTNLWLSLDRSKAASKRAGRLNAESSALQVEVADLLVALGATVPDGTAHL